MTAKIVLGIESLHPPITGVGYYTHHLADELLHSSRVNELVAFSDQGAKSRQSLKLLLEDLEKHTFSPVSAQQSNRIIAVTGKNLKKRLRSIPGLSPSVRFLRKTYRNMALKPYAKSWVFHEPNYVPVIPSDYKGRVVITVHDLSYLRYPETLPQDRLSYFRKELPKAIVRADKIVTDCEAVRQELLATGMIHSESKVSSVHLGVDPGFRPMGQEEIERDLTVLGLRNQGYILSVATIEPRKNIGRLLIAYQRLPQHIAKSFPLVLCGASGWQNDELMRLISSAKGHGKVICTGYLSRPLVQKLMAGAALFAFLPLYEGFGLPVLEAMASGAPVLASDIDSIREISGGAVHLVNPLEEAAIEVGLLQFLENKIDLKKYRGLSIQRANLFSWKKFGDQMIDIYEDLN